MNKDGPIGVFDSGIGGLTVLKHLVTALPNENYIYFGDTARIPYGDKTEKQLIEFVADILNWYKQHNVKAVLMACNTSSAVVLDLIKDKYDFPILGLINPTAKHIANLDIEKIGIIATSATANSKAYSRTIIAHDSSKKVYEIGCPGLVEIVESGDINSQYAKKRVYEYIVPLLENNVEKIVLGCTHYPFLKPVINDITNNPDLLIDPAEFLVNATKDKLETLGLFANQESGTRKYCVSANPVKFVEVGSKFYSDCIEAHEINFNALKI